ncbi:MAG TPA: PilZ domain-containing protein [Terriglobales bacterium]
MDSDKCFLKHRIAAGRRRHKRVETRQGVSVYWACEKLEDTARVRDLSLGGLFVATQEALAVGATLRLDFLVQEGTIRAAGVVRHAEPGRGMGLKFRSVRGEDLQHLVELVNRLSALSSFQPAVRQSAVYSGSEETV